MAQETSGVEFGAFHLSANPNLYQPQLAQNFSFVFPQFSKLLKAGCTGEEDDAYLYDVTNTLTVSLKSCEVPSYNQGVIPIRRGNSMAKYAGTIEWNDIAMSFNCFEGAGTKDALMAWQNLTYNIKKDTISCLDNVLTDFNYKLTCYILEYSGDWRLQRTWKIINAFPTNLKFTTYSFDSNNTPITADLTLAYDRAEIVYNG